MQKEARMLFRMKKIVDDTAILESPTVILKQKIMLEDSFGRLLRTKEISGRAFGIIKRYLEKKVPKEKYCYYENNLVKKRRSSSENLTEKELDKLVARSNDAC